MNTSEGKHKRFLRLYLISGRNESFSEDDSSNISKVPLDIFNVGTGTGTERTNWLIVSDGDDESIRSASAETSVDSKRVSTTGRNARLNSRPNCVIMSDDDMVAAITKEVTVEAVRAFWSVRFRTINWPT